MNLSTTVEAYLEQNFAGFESTIYRDLSLNFTKLLNDGPLTPEERFMSLLSIAVSLEDTEMIRWAAKSLKDLGVEETLIREAAETAGIMGMNTTYYKFRGYLPESVKENYSRAGLRMQSMMKPISGKEKFEMMSMAVSVVNGCPICIANHEKSLTDIGVSADKIHEIARMAAVAKGIKALKSTKALF